MTWIKRMAAGFLCLLMVCMLLPVGVYAANSISTGTKCSLEISFTPEGLKASGVSFKLYRVASVSSDGKFTATSKFSGQSVMSQLKDPSESVYRTVTSTLVSYIMSGAKITPDYSGTTGSDGKVTFSNIYTGLYLVMGEMYQEGDVLYSPLNYLVCAPNRQEDGSWSYNISSTVKWERKTFTDTIEIKVVKAWSDSSVNVHRNDVVKVNLYREGTLYDTRNLSTGNNWTTTWTDLDAHYNWSVQEQSFTGYNSKLEEKDYGYLITNTPINPAPDDPHHDDPLPQTGLVWWPVPLLVVTGFAFIVSGLIVRKKKYE